MKLGVVEPQMLIRRALCSLLSTLPGQRVVLNVESALDNLELIQRLHPDVLLVDVSNPVRDLAVVSQLSKLFSQTKLLVLADSADEEFQVRAIKAGAWGCVSKRSDPEALENALKVLERGEFWVSRRLANVMLGKLANGSETTAAESEGLTERELEVLALVANGCRNKEIAGRLSISEHTIKAHLGAIYRKLRVSTRLAAAMYYFQQAQQPRRERRPRARLEATGGSAA